MGLLNILYQDGDLVAVNKPDGLLVHRSRQSRDHVVVMQLVRDQLNCFVYAVHRLDRAAAGVLLFALSPEMATMLIEAFASRRIQKEYGVVVRGLAPESGVEDSPLRDPDTGEEQAAVTEYRRLGVLHAGTEPDGRPRVYSLLAVFPHTGRTHQIRRHMKRIGYPVIGDTRHGHGEHNRFFREQYGVRRLLLFARRVTLDHPRTGAPLTIEAPYPDDWQSVIARFL